MRLNEIPIRTLQRQWHRPVLCSEWHPWCIHWLLEHRWVWRDYVWFLWLSFREVNWLKFWSICWCVRSNVEWVVSELCLTTHVHELCQSLLVFDFEVVTNTDRSESGASCCLWQRRLQWASLIPWWLCWASYLTVVHRVYENWSFSIAAEVLIYWVGFLVVLMIHKSRPYISCILLRRISLIQILRLQCLPQLLRIQYINLKQLFWCWLAVVNWDGLHAKGVV